MTQEKATQEAERLKAEDRRKREELQRENRTLWIAHFRRLAASNLAAARDYRRRARELERGGAA